MNNFNPNYNVFDSGDANNELFSSQSQTWHSYATRLNKPNSHQNIVGNDLNVAHGEDYYNKHVPQNQGVTSYNNYAGPSNINYFPFEAGTNYEAPFNYPVPTLQILNQPTRNVNNFPVHSAVPNNENTRAPFNYPVPSLPILNNPTRNVNNYPVHSAVPNNENTRAPFNYPVPSLQSPVTNNENIRGPNGDFYNFFLNNQHEKIVKSSNGNDVRVLTYTRDEYDRINLGKTFNCNFCKRLGKPRHLYSSHSTRENGVVSCPVLRQSICAVCHRRGHTSKYCQSINHGALNN